MNAVPVFSRDPNDDSESPQSTRRLLLSKELLDKATRLFAEQGYESTTLRDIAEAVGISRPALYHYVSSKEDFLVALVEQSRELATSLIELRRREDLDSIGKLRTLTEFLVRQRAEAPDRFRVLDRSESLLPEETRSEHRHLRQDILRELTGIINEGIASGAFRSVDSRIAAFSVLGMCNWVAWWFRPDSEKEIDDVVREISQSAVIMLQQATLGGAGSPIAQQLLESMRSNVEILERLADNENPVT
jgi:AcrR family transcriptional regulator